MSGIVEELKRHGREVELPAGFKVAIRGKKPSDTSLEPPDRVEQKYKELAQDARDRQGSPVYNMLESIYHTFQPILEFLYNVASKESRETYKKLGHVGRDFYNMMVRLENIYNEHTDVHRGFLATGDVLDKGLSRGVAKKKLALLERLGKYEGTLSVINGKVVEKLTKKLKIQEQNRLIRESSVLVGDPMDAKRLISLCLSVAEYIEDNNIRIGKPKKKKRTSRGDDAYQPPDDESVPDDQEDEK